MIESFPPITRHGSHVTALKYDAANEQIRFNSATTNLVYDNNGNLTSFTDGSGTTTYTWNARNQLTAISGPGLTASFGYDGLGRRSSKTVNSTTTGFWYDGDDVLAELSGSTPTATYIRSLSIDEPFIRKGASDEFYQGDALGSPLALTDTNGAAQTTYTYEPFGNTAVTGTSTNPFHYTGRENDATGVYYYRARYYSSKLQRFFSEDPIGLRGGDLNVYAYVGNNSTQFTDPHGLFTKEAHQKIADMALQMEGCSDAFRKEVAGWDVKTDEDFYTFEPELAFIHGQRVPKSSIQHSVTANWGFINRQLRKGTERGLGYAMHATEDLFSRSHQWTTALPNSSLLSIILDPRHWLDWGEHRYYDKNPGDEFWHAVEADRRIIKRWKRLSGRKDDCQ